MVGNLGAINQGAAEQQHANLVRTIEQEGGLIDFLETNPSVTGEVISSNFDSQTLYMTIFNFLTNNLVSNGPKSRLRKLIGYLHGYMSIGEFVSEYIDNGGRVEKELRRRSLIKYLFKGFDAIDALLQRIAQEYHKLYNSEHQVSYSTFMVSLVEALPLNNPRSKLGGKERVGDTAMLADIGSNGLWQIMVRKFGMIRGPTFEITNINNIKGLLQAIISHLPWRVEEIERIFAATFSFIKRPFQLFNFPWRVLSQQWFRILDSIESKVKSEDAVYPAAFLYLLGQLGKFLSPPWRVESKIVNISSLTILTASDNAMLEWGDQLPLREDGLLDLRKLLLPSEIQLREILDLEKIRQETEKYIKRYVSEKIRDVALNNLEDLFLWPYMREARRYNILLVVSRGLDMSLEQDRRKFERYFPTLMRVFKKIPSELYWELDEPVGFEVAKTEENVAGFTKTKDERGGIGVGVTVFMKKEESRGRPHKGTFIYDEGELMETVVHELQGHKRALTTRPRYLIKNGRIYPENKQELIMERSDWLAVGRINNINYIIPRTQRLTEVLENGWSLDTTISMEIEDLPEDSQQLLDVLLHLYRLPRTYYSDIREIVAFSAEGDDLVLPDLYGEIRYDGHKLHPTREVLKTSVSRIGIPVDPVNHVYVSYLYNRDRGKIEETYVQNNGTTKEPKWFEVHREDDGGENK